MTAPTAGSTGPTTGTASGASKTVLSYFIQLGGIAAMTLGAILSMHHIAIGASLLGGAVAFYIGEKIRTLA
jgi:hypothetical protein